MPPYAGTVGAVTPNPVIPTALWPGDDFWFWGTSPTVGPKPTDANVVLETAAALAAVTRSLSCTLAPQPSGGPPTLMVQVIASGNPGAAEIDVQDAGIDGDGVYVTPTGSTAYKITVWTATPGGQYVGWTELSPEVGKFISLKMISNPNNVNFAAKGMYI